jgi:hypothetical protein
MFLPSLALLSSDGQKAEILAQCRVAAESAPPLMGWPAPAPWLTAAPEPPKATQKFVAGDGFPEA